MTDLNRLVRLVSMLLCPLGLLLFLKQFYLSPYCPHRGGTHHRGRHDRHDPRGI